MQASFQVRSIVTQNYIFICVLLFKTKHVYNNNAVKHLLFVLYCIIYLTVIAFHV